MVPVVEYPEFPSGYETTPLGWVFFGAGILGVFVWVYAVFAARSWGRRGGGLLVAPLVVGLVLLVGGLGGAWITEQVVKARLERTNDALWDEYKAFEEGVLDDLEDAYGVVLRTSQAYPFRGSQIGMTATFPDGRDEECVLTAGEEFLVLDCPSELPRDPARSAS